MPLPYSLDLTTLSAAYAQGRLSPVAVARDIGAAMVALNDNPVWIHRVPLADIEIKARELEVRRAAGETLPLYGIPFAVKDNIDVAGCPTTAACPAYRYVPDQTAPAVQRLLDAGALLIGKTNLDQFATGLVGTRSPYGACRNAFNADYISGGSSSGSAVAVAAGLVSFALGTDTAGSGRVPAGFNNIVGLKPTPGVVSTRGVMPACRSLDCVSVFALTCEDATRVFDVMFARDADDIYARTDTTAARSFSAAAFRCGVPAAPQLEFFGDETARAAFAQSLATLREIGAEPVEIDFRPFAEAARLLYDGPWVAERYAAIQPFMETHADDVYPVTRQVIESARKWNAVDTFKAFYRLRELKRRCDEQWRKMDVLLVPTSGTIYTHRQIAEAPVARNTDLGYYTNFVNFLDLCALAVPGAFRADGLPAGITLIAAANSDHALAAIGSRFHRASGVLLGATPFPIPSTEPLSASKAHAPDEIVLAVVGAHLSGLPLNHQLTSRGARLLQTTQTAAAYRLYALPGTVPPKPGLVRVGATGAAVAVELWALSPAAFGAFVAEVPSPLAIGTLTLADGRAVKGFLCEACAVEGAQDISSFGGWRAFLASRA